MSTIDVRKVTKKFGEFVAVRDADLKVDAGEVVCLLGPSGCGKTTTLRMIAGLERATAGEVIIAGKNMNELAPEKRDIAMVFQFYALYPALTVGQNISMPLHFEKLSKEDMDKRVMKVAKILALTDVLDRLPGQVSEGAWPWPVRLCVIPIVSCLTNHCRVLMWNSAIPCAGR